MQQGAPSVLRRRSSILKKQQEEERFKTGLEMSKMEFTFDAEKGVFCCNGNGNLILNERESSAIIPDEKHEDIKAFMAAVNSGDVGYAVGEITADEKKKITMVIKVNVREKREDVATIFFASSAEITENPSKKYTAFAKLDKPQAFDLNGECGCFAYTCTAHGKTFRVGQHVIRWTTKKTWARWENRVLDNLMGHPQKVVQNYGQPPIDFRGFI
ncbi:hypothetical protein N431DRAFT_389607 [Stipitochalara longipes BDJ]|nr:hypothetical protein N431DRAFT_389607 [Stipitochalara longipes BDJ]